MKNYKSNDFSKLTEIMTNTIQKDIESLEKVSDFVIVYGVPSGENAEGSSIEEYARVNNYGSITKNIPARPFLSTVLTNYSDSIRKDIRTALGLVKDEVIKEKNLSNDKVRIIFEKYIALALENYTKDNIKNGSWKANSIATITTKGSSKPLIDTGQLIQSIKGIVLDD